LGLGHDFPYSKIELRAKADGPGSAMKLLNATFLAGVIIGSILPALAQDPAYVNRLAPFVSSPEHVVDRMLELAGVKPGETVYDLGAGDGRVVIAAAEKYKANAIGVEISPKLVVEASARIEQLGLAEHARVIQGDVLKTDLSRADVVIIYLVTSLN